MKSIKDHFKDVQRHIKLYWKNYVLLYVGGGLWIYVIHNAIKKELLDLAFFFSISSFIY